jgi:HCNGP-like protein
MQSWLVKGSLASDEHFLCPLQAMLTKMDEASKTGNMNLIKALKARRDYSNPYFLKKMVETYEINELGTCFAKDIWDPTSLPKEDFYDEYGPLLVKTRVPSFN